MSGLPETDAERAALLDRWIEALRSGEYRQGKGSLKRLEGCQGEVVSHCCLGVLSELAGFEEVEPEHGISLGRRAFKAPAESGLPEDEVVQSIYLPVRLFPGMTPDGLIQGTDRWERLAHLNDNGTSFAEIADLIERHRDAILGVVSGNETTD